MSVDFERAVLRELDQIVKRIDAAVEKLEERDESRDGEVSELKLQVGLLRSECRRNIRRDGILVMAPTTLTAIITAVLGQVGHPAAAAPMPAPARVECGNGVVEAPERCDDGKNLGAPGMCLPGCMGWGRVAP